MLFMGVCLWSESQTKYTAAVWKDSGFDFTSDHTPIRNWKQNYSISFVRDNSDGYLVLIDHSDFYTTPLPVVVPPYTPAPPSCSVYHAPMPVITNYDGIDVRDIYIVDDKAFFCGCLMDTTGATPASKPMWGYINLLDFFSGTINIYLNILFDLPPAGTAPYALDRLVAYQDGGLYNVIAFSRASYPCSKIIEIQDVLGTAPNCWTYDLPISNPHVLMCDMYIDDIFLDDTYVIVSGHDLSTVPLNRVWYGIYKRTNIIGTIGNTFAFPTTEIPTGSVICSDIKGTDEFALAYSYYEEGLGTWYTRIRVINKINGDNIVSQQFVKDYKYNPLRMTYLSDISSIELVQEKELSSSFVRIDPYTSMGYTTSELELRNYFFYNIDAIGGYHFITTYQNYFYLQDRTMNLPASSSACPDNYSIKVESILNLIPMTLIIPSPFPLANYPDRQRVSVTNNSISTVCFSYE